jgi:hypothetical protein
MEPIFTELANTDTLLNEYTVVVYGKYRFDAKDDMTIGEVLKAMTKLFPELHNAIWKLDVANNVLHISVRPIETIETLRRKQEQFEKFLNPDRADIPDIDKDYPTRTYSRAEFGICKDAHHKIIILGSVMIQDKPDIVSVDEFYCPTCNKFWREN